MINDKYTELIKDEYKQSFIKYQKGENTLDAYSSHQPVLIHTLNTITKGNVIEYGVGYHSTPIMHIICGIQGRKLVSLDTDRNWLRRFSDYQCSKHLLMCIDEKQLRKWKSRIFKYKYAIAFVDGAPGLMRQVFINNMKKYVDYFIVHDTEEVGRGVVYPFPSPYQWDFSGFKHVYHLPRLGPGVSLISNLDKIDEKLLTIF